MDFRIGFGILFTLGGVFTLLESVNSFLKKHKQLSQFIRAKGTVVKNRVESAGDYAQVDWCYPTIQFQIKNGKSIVFESTNPRVQSKMHPINSKIDIIYDEQDPKNAETDSHHWSRTITYGIISLLCLIIGMLLIQSISS